jgi:uncharacterized tellurite resistance protein B-like protein
MEISEFSQQQQLALLDLLVLGMYADGHLARAEDARIEKLLTTMGYKTAYDRQVQFDASVTRVRKHLPAWDAILACAKELAGNFSKPEERQKVFALLEDVLASDQNMSENETRFLAGVRELFHM